MEVQKLGVLVPPEAFKPHTEEYRDISDEREKLDKLEGKAKKGKGAGAETEAEADASDRNENPESMVDAEAVEEVTNTIAEACNLFEMHAATPQMSRHRVS